MAGNELNSFVSKFVSLWKSGCDAELKVESKDGKAFATLKVGLGYDLYGLQGGVHQRRGGGGPARQRRRERRAKERETVAAAEKAVVKVEGKDNIKTVDEGKLGLTEEVTYAEIEALDKGMLMRSVATKMSLK